MDTEKKAEEPRPVEISHIEEFEFLRIIWDDGHLSDYALAYLRSYCPCSVCQGRGDYSRFKREDFQMPIISAFEDTAVRVTWANARHTSNYSFTFLRSLCSCRMCRAERMLGG